LDQIDEYLMDRMSAEVRTQFETALVADPALANTVEELRQIKHAIGYQLYRRRRKTMYLLAAIAACVLVCVGVFFMNSAEKPRGTKLYTEYYSQDPGLPTLMDSGTEEYVFYQGMVDYKSGNYRAALERWHSVDGSNQYADTLTFYMAMAHLGLNDLAQAFDHLAQVNESGPFGQKRNWYSALIALKHGDLQTTRQLLEPLSTSPGLFQQRAVTLLDRLETQ
jgi:hypothetical protein